MSNFIALKYGIAIAPGAYSHQAKALLTDEALELLADLHRVLEPQRRSLLAERKRQQKRYDAGEHPTFVADHIAQRKDWQVAPIPHDLQERRVEITGPVNSAKMVINMLNGTKEAIPDMAMLDFEDSMKPSWQNVIDGLFNIIGVAKNHLTFVQPATKSKPEKSYSLNTGKRAKMMIRVRGLHLNEANILVDGEPLSAAVFDLAMCTVHSARILLDQGKTPKYYVPKCETYQEARWWNQVFDEIEQKLTLPLGCLRVTLLIETLPATYQMEEILYEMRSRACGLNGGRWDKIFSDIKVLRRHKDRILADRASIDMKTPWMDNYAKRLIRICHKHGAFAMGGMSAFTPGQDEETRKLQLEKVREDKAREASIGHDGCWVSHPFFVAIARAQFTKKNQLDVLLEDFNERPELLPEPTGPRTIEGLRKNIRVGIAYMNGWRHDLGCIAFDNLMEDLATLEISRAQVWQWLHHKVVLDDGTKVTKELVQQLFREEAERIIAETKQEEFIRAADEAQNLFLEPELKDFLTTSSEPVAEAVMQ